MAFRHKVLVRRTLTIRANKDHIRVLLYSCYTTIKYRVGGPPKVPSLWSRPAVQGLGSRTCGGQSSLATILFPCENLKITGIPSFFYELGSTSTSQISYAGFRSFHARTRAASQVTPKPKTWLSWR